MPLIALNDYVDGVEELKAMTGYGIPKSYPLAINGLFGTGTGMGALGCGGDCQCSKCKGISGLGDIDFSGIGSEPTWRIDEGGTPAVGPAPSGGTTWHIDEGGTPTAGPAPAGGGVGAPKSQFAEKVNVVSDAIAKLGAAFAPAFQKAPRQKVVVQKERDYTTYAVIGGAVIVASVLAIAVGKSGRK